MFYFPLLLLCHVLRDDDVDCHLPNPPEEVQRREVQIPPPPPIPQDEDTNWWIAQCGGSEVEVVSQTSCFETH